MLKNFFKNLLSSDIDYVPRFIEKNVEKKAISVRIQNIDDYSCIQESFNSLPSAVRVRYAYALVSSR